MNNIDILGISNRINHGNLVAGAAAEGHGALTAWLGRGARTGAELAVLTEGIIPSAWLPAPKDTAVQLGRAIQSIAGARYTAKPVRHSRDPEVRQTETWIARWILVTMPVASEVQAGQTYGAIALVATLTGDDESGVNLTCETQPTLDAVESTERSQLCSQLHLAYHTLTSTQVHQASDITRWLGYTLRRRLNAVRYGATYYLPSESRETGEALVNALRSDSWGTHWMYPPLPVATTGQLSLGLALGLALDVTELADDLGIARAAAIAEGRADVGPRALNTAREKLGIIKARINFYADRLGEARSEVDGPVKDLEVVFEEIERVHAAQAEVGS